MEEKVKKRGWIKNAAIIFLSVMLILTFFSNTIMNRSLPEAATQCVTSGTIETKVRGTGTVSAKENYDVIIDQTRKVVSVPVKVGQTVSTGDVLFTLEPGDSEELDQARETLYQLQMDYQKALLDVDSADYSKENREIEKAREALELANAALAKLKEVTQAEVDAAQTAVDNAVTSTEKCQDAVDAAQYGFDHSSDGSSSGGNVSSSYQERVTAAQTALEQAKETNNAAILAYGNDYKALEKTAIQAIVLNKPELLNNLDYTDITTANDNQYQLIKDRCASYLPYYMEMSADALDVTNAEKKKQKVAYTEITAAETALKKAQNELNAAQNALNDAYNDYTYEPGTTYNGKTHSYYVKELATANEALKTAKKIQTDHEKALKKLTDGKTAYDTAKTTARTCDETLSDQLFELAQKQKNDGKAQQEKALDLQDKQRKITKQKELVEELAGIDEKAITEVKAKVNGNVKSIAVSAGRKANAGDVLATIEVPDLGFTMSFSVTSEQARKVRVGDTASVSNYYWGSQIDAELVSIKTDPQNPQTSKLLTFDVKGDVSDGASLSLAVGQKSAEYDFVVPNSAIRTDSNGSFVLIVTVKSSPLGNRYTATRVDVEVVASDDTNSAVTGALNDNDYVITTSNKPIANGDPVRLPDNI